MPLNFSLAPIAWVIVAALVATGGFLVIDRIGDRREAKVRAELEPVIALRTTERDAWKAEHKRLLDDAARLDALNKEKLTHALAAKAAAQALEASRPDPADAAHGLRVELAF